MIVQKYVYPEMRMVSLVSGVLMVSVRTATESGGSPDSGVYAGQSMALDVEDHGSSFTDSW